MCNAYFDTSRCIDVSTGRARFLNEGFVSFNFPLFNHGGVDEEGVDGCDEEDGEGEEGEVCDEDEET